MRFSDVRHQERALSIIRRALVSGRTHHAYLFEGPPGVGKELTARALAARLLCDADLPPDADACGACPACRVFPSGNHPDFHLIHRGLHKLHPDAAVRARKGLFLSVDIVRHFLIEPASNSPTLGRRRVFIVRDAERMNEGAQNALLKTLEEPPGSVCLILVTSSAERLLPTIRSRCQRVPFDLLPADFVRRQLQERTGVEPAAAHTLAALAQGRLGDALQWQRIGLPDALRRVCAALAGDLPNDPEAFGRLLVEIAEGLATRNVTYPETDEQPDNEAVADDHPRGGSRPIDTDALRGAAKLVLLLAAVVVRDALVVSAGGDARLCALPSGTPAVAHLAETLTGDQLAERSAAFATAERMLDRNVAPQLACERLAVALTGELGVC